MRTIWKFPLTASAAAAQPVTHVYKGLYAGLDADGNECVWAEVDNIGDESNARFVVFGTGHLIPHEDNFEYVDSYVSGAFVWHVYIEWLDR